MAVCGKIYKGQDLSCGVAQKGYVQEIVLVNHSDIKTKGISVDCDDQNQTYKAAVVLEDGKKGVLFKGPAAGNILRVITSKARDDNGFPTYTHGVNMLIGGVTQEQKCILSGLDQGLVVAFAKLKTYDEPSGGMVEAIEVVGLNNGLTTEDYEYDLTESGGAVPINLRSLENSMESQLPYMYESPTPGSEVLDFDALFENVNS